MRVQQPGDGANITTGGGLTEGIAVGVHRAPQALKVHGPPEIRDGEDIGRARLHPVNRAGECVGEFLHRGSAPTGSLYASHDGCRRHRLFRVPITDLLGGVGQQFAENETAIIGVQGTDALPGAQGDDVA